MYKKIIAVIISIVMAFSCLAVIPSAETSDTMRFGSDGKFKIVVFADTQDTDNPNQTMIKMMHYALDTEQPDMVVFTGDNVVGVGSSESRFRTGATKLLQPLIQRNIPYAYTFGNHDAENISKPFMHSVYKSLGRCLTYNADDSIFGYGNCNIPIYSSTGNDIAFNLWIIDSNMYPAAGVSGTYDYVHTDQLNWFKSADAALEASVGHKVNSLVFQHIALPEIYNCLKTSALGTKKYNGTRYSLSLNSSAHGTLGEFPCPPDVNNGEFQALKDRGDVIGVVTGHDHSNSFVGTYQGIDFIQFPGMTFYSYGKDNVRGYGVIELNENNTTTYSSYTVRYKDVNLDSYPYETPDIVFDFGERTGGSNEYYRYNSGTYISDIKCANNSSASSAQNALTSAGYNVIDFDLNKGAGGDYIYMGYKTTTDPSKAIKDICFYSDPTDCGCNKFTIKINGKACEYIVDNYTDLNKGSGGDYIYACYTKDSMAGAPITSISFDTSTGGSGKVCGEPATPNIPADLNNGTSKHENAIYCFTESSAQIITQQVNELKAKYNQLSTYLADDRFNETSKTAFVNEMNEVKSFIDAVDSSRVTDKSDSEMSGMKYAMMDSCASLVAGASDSEFIYGIASPSTPDSIAERFNNGYASVNIQPTGKYLGTGSVVTLSYEGRTKQYRTVTFGDINGDGWYDGQDASIALCIKNGMLSENDIGGAAYTAADCSHDGVIDEADIEILNQAGVLLADIDQSKSGDELETSSVYTEYLSLIDQNPVIDEEEPEIDPEFSMTFLERVYMFFKNIFEYFCSLFESLLK